MLAALPARSCRRVVLAVGAALDELLWGGLLRTAPCSEAGGVHPNPNPTRDRGPNPNPNPNSNPDPDPNPNPNPNPNPTPTRWRPAPP